MFAIFFYPSASAVRCDAVSLGQALSRLWSWWISKGFEAWILQLPSRQNKWWLQVLWEQDLLSEIALRKVQVAVESFRLCSTDELCVCSSGVVSVCACRTILGCGFGVWCPLAAHKSSSLVRPPWLWHWADKLTGAVSVGNRRDKCSWWQEWGLSLMKGGVLQKHCLTLFGNGIKLEAVFRFCIRTLWTWLCCSLSSTLAVALPLWFLNLKRWQWQSWLLVLKCSFQLSVIAFSLTCLVLEA